MSHHCSPQSLHLLRFVFFFLAFTSTCSNFPGSKSAGMCRFFFGYPCEHPEYLERNAPPAVPDPRNPGPESELSRVCPDPCRDPGSLSPCHITALVSSSCLVL